ncbi:hypothetical protein GCM10010412_008180 [Nonomuraea recticatena]|uniref:Uncharacterized protein n=1 Tax=Nonomuraea recticatena TaxID=46178 RepID=A0ABN3R7U1_9ACTN
MTDDPCVVSCSVSTARPQHEDLIAHLTRTSPLGPGEAARVVAEVLSYYSETVEEFVRRRHGELKSRGLTNDEIFPRIAAELPARRMAPPELSLRQLRRIVYG